MSLEEDVAVAHANCPCWLEPWGATKCRNCSVSRKHHLDQCEWRGHVAIERVVQTTKFDALRRINRYVDRDPRSPVRLGRSFKRGGDGSATSPSAARGRVGQRICGPGLSDTSFRTL